jgi:hypothetical protein
VKIRWLAKRILKNKESPLFGLLKKAGIQLEIPTRGD